MAADSASNPPLRLHTGARWILIRRSTSGLHPVASLAPLFMRFALSKPFYSQPQRSRRFGKNRIRGGYRLHPCRNGDRKMEGVKSAQWNSFEVRQKFARAGGVPILERMYFEKTLRRVFPERVENSPFRRGVNFSIAIPTRKQTLKFNNCQPADRHPRPLSQELVKLIRAGLPQISLRQSAGINVDGAQRCSRS